MEALLVSTLVVAIGEIGDKTQLLALILAARFRRPLPIIAGILVATLANHTLAGVLGEWVRNSLSPDMLRWALGASFIAIGLWALKPDKLDEHPSTRGNYGVFKASPRIPLKAVRAVAAALFIVPGAAALVGVEVG